MSDGCVYLASARICAGEFYGGKTSSFEGAAENDEVVPSIYYYYIYPLDNPFFFIALLLLVRWCSFICALILKNISFITARVLR